MSNDISENVTDIIAIIKQNHFKMYMFGVAGKTKAHDYFEVTSYYNSKEISVTFSDMP